MAGAREFGRRQTPPGAPVLTDPRSYGGPDPLALSPEAEDFRRSLGSAFAKPQGGFSAWWRAQAGSRALLWLLNIVLIAPGLLCAALGQGVLVSGIAETLGLGLAFWLRRERRRRLRAITQWTDAEPPGVAGEGRTTPNGA